jgi:hypothetical protein
MTVIGVRRRVQTERTSFAVGVSSMKELGLSARSIAPGGLHGVCSAACFVCAWAASAAVV